MSIINMQLTPECDKCGERFPIKRKDALPAMVGFECEDGSVIKLCRNCIIKLGTLDEKGKEEFFKDLRIGGKNE